MPVRSTAPVGAPCWVDLSTSDLETSLVFYSALLGWTADDPADELGGYVNLRKDGELVAGCMAAQPGGMPDVWSVYLASEDVAKTVEAATATGGQVVVGPMPVADLGTMAFLVDPGGAGIGVWQPGTHPGFTVWDDSGTPRWFELVTREYDRSVAFYRDVFRWDTEDVGDTVGKRYTAMVHGDDRLAGIMDGSGSLPPTVPSHWSVYFGVDDTDEAVAEAIELGGSVIQPAEDSPYGRFAALADATGARFRLLGPPA